MNELNLIDGHRIDKTIAASTTDKTVAKFIPIVLDLASQDAIKKAAAEVNALGIPIHVSNERFTAR